MCLRENKVSRVLSISIYTLERKVSCFLWTFSSQPSERENFKCILCNWFGRVPVILEMTPFWRCGVFGPEWCGVLLVL